ncbi:SAM domain-containing protein SAMSN-1 [Bombina bombina]|uniref:SAM domain-containing protein SAMSN-1 n=1 Tax=Bombina bombina TaxID=8345 RepID=UPI00235AB52D|nr:SAM domain-containing protein SAMSN-1 [Bombina bombina]
MDEDGPPPPGSRKKMNHHLRDRRGAPQLEGSMDNLYEPVENIQDSKENNVCRASTLLNSSTKNVPNDASLSLEFSDFDHADATKKQKRSLMQKSVSENEAFDRRIWTTTHWHNSRKGDNDSYLRRHCYIEDLSDEDFIMGDKIHLLTRKKAEETLHQISTCEQWNLPHIQSVQESSNDMEFDDSKSEATGTLKRLQKLVRTKKSCTNENVKHNLLPRSHSQDTEEEEEALTTCMKLTKSQDKKIYKEHAKQKHEAETCEQMITTLDQHCNTKWNNYGNVHSEKNSYLFTNWKSFPDSEFDPFLFSISQIEEWEKCTCCIHHTQISPSLTDMDLPYSWRKTSFGAFDRLRKQSTSKSEDVHEGSQTETLYEGGVPDTDKTHNNTGSLSKKMKAISLTMKKKMGKKYSKGLSEDMHEDGDEFYSHRYSDPGGGIYLKSSESIESLYSLNSGQSSSSGVTSSSDATSNRDSFRLDEDIPYTGPFCGRAKVHTDFTPSPYDTDSLKIKKGDIIDIIYKTPMGIWTGMLNNKVGNFKFIYVDIIFEEEIQPKKIIKRRRSKRPKPKTMEELLERLNLQDYISSLLLNGYETLEDLKDLKESHLYELNITSMEDRERLLSAIENLQDCENDGQTESEHVALTLSPNMASKKHELDDCARDSGCYITLDNSDNSKDNDSQILCESVKKITITDLA